MPFGQKYCIFEQFKIKNAVFLPTFQIFWEADRIAIPRSSMIATLDTTRAVMGFSVKNCPLYYTTWEWKFPEF